MTHLEDRITAALRTDPTRPSPDLYERVVDSIDADRQRHAHAFRHSDPEYYTYARTERYPGSDRRGALEHLHQGARANR